VWDTEAEVTREARTLIDQHDRNAVYVALDQLNASIDRDDRRGRDFWVQVVRVIHEYHRPIRPSLQAR
jgi:hypothetical protein